MAIPLLDIKAQNAALKSEIMSALESVVDSCGFILGPQCEALEKELAAFTGAKHGIGVSSGTDAILVALMALGIGPGDEVLVPTFTFFATAGCVARLGATPVFVDSRLSDFNMDPADLERKITPKSKAIMPVHLFGQCAPMDEILKIAKAHGLPVIEDAAQAIGAECPSGKSCAMGELAATSFYPTKNLGAMGDAGMVFANDDRLAEICVKLRNHGMSPRYYHAMVGGNFRLDAMQATVLRIKLKKLSAYRNARAAHAERYNQALAGAKGVAFADEDTSDARLILPRPLKDNFHVWNQYTVRVPGRRDALKALFAEKGIGCDIYYPLTLDRQECFKGASCGGETCTNAHALADEVLSIPVYPELPSSSQDEVIGVLEAFASAR